MVNTSYSLTNRLIAVTGIGSIIAIVAAAFTLIALFDASLERNFDRQLQYFVEGLVVPVNNILEQPKNSQDKAKTIELGHPAFIEPGSGWYWQIREENQKIIIESQSLFGHILNWKPKGHDLGTFQKETIRGPQGNNLRIVSASFQFTNHGTYIIAVAGNTNNLEEEILRFGSLSGITLTVFGIILAVSSLFAVKLALKPIGGLTDAIGKIKSGKQARLSGNFPRELSPLSDELNGLLQHNEQIVERAKTHVGNLAHGLKTPISVLRNATQHIEQSQQTLFKGQIENMREQVEHHLEKARRAALSVTTRNIVEIEPLVEKLVRVFKKIYPDVEIKLTHSRKSQFFVRAETQDLEDIFGNLIDNSCKYSNGRVWLSIINENSELNSEATIQFIIEDNGAGLSDSEKHTVLHRGKRLDETKNGAGLGLSIVGDVVESYQGSFFLNDSQYGGLSAHVRLRAQAKA